MEHTPVLLHEVLETLAVQPSDTVVDGTVNGGGHAAALVKLLGHDGLFVGIDQDASAISRATKRLYGSKCRSLFLEGNFRSMDTLLSRNGIKSADVILLDLGLSSHQLESSGRGFSFRREEPLIMTFSVNPKDNGPTAETIINEWSEETLADIIYGFGGERYARRIARGIVADRAKRPIKTTKELVRVILEVLPAHTQKTRIHPATKVFQAIRIAVNDELNSLSLGLVAGWKILKNNGRFATITFHELEDRIVKNYFRERTRAKEGILVNKKPISPLRSELTANPRSRSAKLRVIRKI